MLVYHLNYRYNKSKTVGFNKVTQKKHNNAIHNTCKACVLVAEKSGEGEQKLCLQWHSLKIKTTGNRTIYQWVQNPSHTRITCTSTYNKQFRTRTWGEQRVKYTTCNDGIETRCVGRQYKTNGKLKVDR